MLGQNLVCLIFLCVPKAWHIVGTGYAFVERKSVCAFLARFLPLFVILILAIVLSHFCQVPSNGVCQCVDIVCGGERDAEITNRQVFLANEELL